MALEAETQIEGKAQLRMSNAALCRVAWFKDLCTYMLGIAISKKDRWHRFHWHERREEMTLALAADDPRLYRGVVKKGWFGAEKAFIPRRVIASKDSASFLRASLLSSRSRGIDQLVHSTSLAHITSHTIADKK